MKRALILWLLFTCVLHAQVPNTTTFSLQDVKDELNSSSNDLVSFFAEANANGFDPAYEGSKNSLLNFRNYSHYNGYTLFQKTKVSELSNVDACYLANDTHDTYHDGVGTYPAIGDTTYRGSAFIPFNGYDKWYKVPGANNVIKINTSGVVTNLSICF